MRNKTGFFLMWVLVGWALVCPAVALADDCGSESDCSRAPNNISGATGLAAAGAGAAAATAAAKARNKKVPATFSVSWEDVLIESEREDDQGGSSAVPENTSARESAEDDPEAGRNDALRRRRGPPDRPLGE